MIWLKIGIFVRYGSLLFPRGTAVVIILSLQVIKFIMLCGRFCAKEIVFLPLTPQRHGIDAPPFTT